MTEVFEVSVFFGGVDWVCSAWFMGPVLFCTTINAAIVSYYVFGYVCLAGTMGFAIDVIWFCLFICC